MQAGFDLFVGQERLKVVYMNSVLCVYVLHRSWLSHLSTSNMCCRAFRLQASESVLSFARLQRWGEAIHQPECSSHDTTYDRGMTKAKQVILKHVH